MTNAWKHGPALGLIAAGLAGFALPASAQAPKSPGCGMATQATAEVASVRDGRSLMLTDGRELRLAGIEAEGATVEALQRLAAGKTLRLAQYGAGPDRYGRLVAFAYAPGAEQPLQHDLLLEGQARVAARVGDPACARMLLDAERISRAAGRGLWADPNFAPLSSENLTMLAAVRGRFALVEGKVLSVRESGATIYINFGRRWTRDFTVTILKRQRTIFANAGIEPEKLAGRRIRVRGWVERRGGPIIEAASPEQIELID